VVSNRVLPASVRFAHQRRKAYLQELLSGPMGLWDKAAGGHLARELEAMNRPPEEVYMGAMEKLRAALLAWSADGLKLETAARRWRPDASKPGKSLSGDDLDQHPPEHRARKLREAQTAIRAHDAAVVRDVDPLILEAEKEPVAKLQNGTRLGAGELGEVTLLVQQYRDLAKPQQAELQTLALAALERGELVTALQHKRAAQTLHITTPELDKALAERDPVRVQGKAQLEVIRSWSEAAKAEIARRHSIAGIPDGGDQIAYLTYAQEHGMDPDGSGQYVQAAVGNGVATV
jgi:hypothetical protein